MKRVLVTGLSGFIGRHIAPFLLDRGFAVHGIGRRGAPDGLSKDVKWAQLDLFDYAGTRKFVGELQPTHCLNLAWHIEHGKFWRAPQNLASVQAAFNLLDAFANSGGTRFVGAGSCAEYDWSSKGVLGETTTPRTPATPFGGYKNAAFEATMAHANATGISAAWGRVFFLYGPGEAPTRLVPHVILQLLAGAPAKTSHGEQIRDFLHVEDVAAAFAALLDCDVKGGVNIGAGDGVALKTIINRIAERLGRPDLVQLGAVPPQQGEPPLLVAQTARLRDEVGFTPRWSLNDGIDSMIAHCRANHAQGA